MNKLNPILGCISSSSRFSCFQNHVFLGCYVRIEDVDQCRKLTACSKNDGAPYGSNRDLLITNQDQNFKKIKLSTFIEFIQICTHYEHSDKVFVMKTVIFLSMKLCQVLLLGGHNRQKRMKELDRTATPLPFTCYYAKRVDDPTFVEQKLHQAFDEQNKRQQRTFQNVARSSKGSLEIASGEDVTPKDDELKMKVIEHIKQRKSQKQI